MFFSAIFDPFTLIKWVSIVAFITLIYKIVRILLLVISLKKNQTVYAQPDIRNVYLKSKVPEQIDCIVIGSGMGGLVSSALLSKMGQRVLVLEQHDVIGGTLHTFNQQGFTFDTGLHYIGNGDAEPGASYLDVLRLVTSKQIDWNIHKVYDHIQAGEKSEKFTFSAGRENHMNNLKKAFPDSHQLIDIFDKKLTRGMNAMKVHGMVHVLAHPLLHKLFHSLINLFYGDVYQKTIQEVFQEVGIYNDKKLAATIVGQLGDIGLFPDECGFMLFCGLHLHYMLGGSIYPKKGSMDIVRSVASTIVGNKGTILVKAFVNKILVVDGKVTGVQMKGGQIIKCDKVISSIGRLQTTKIIPNPDVLPVKYPQARGHIYGFFGLKGSFEMPEGNHWYWPYQKKHDFDMRKLDSDYKLGFSKEKIEDINLENMFMFFKFSKHPDDPEDQQTCLIITEAPDQIFEKFMINDVQRKDGYKDIKEQIQAHMISKLEQLYPKIKGQIVYSDIGTSLTNQHYFQRISSYGMKLTVNRMFDSDVFFNADTKIQGLYLTGQDVTNPGVAGAIVSGFFTGARLIGAI